MTPPIFTYNDFKAFILSLCLLLIPYATKAENLNTDSITLEIIKSEKFKITKLIAPITLIGIGSWGVSNGWLRHIDNSVKEDMAHLRGNCYFRADDWIQYVPVAGYVGLGFIPGFRPSHSFKERLMAGVTAYGIMALIVNPTKVLVKEKRPDFNARNSFPSGHTATAFTGAELIRLEYGNWAGVGAYTIAASVAFLRLYNDRHWLNDVIAGAGIGILSAQAAYWLLPAERKLFHISNKRDLAILPYYSPIVLGGGFAITLAI